ncbi:hypothetical protein KAMAJI_00820 [Serratia phage vB_SmaM-Kamaji]|nr:hypothetical protein KAMAJI_00820 [Serratia phage vB_SmaM-Kamaji]
MKYKPDNRGNIGLEGKAPHNLIAFTKCYTGYVGSESTDMLYFPKGDDIDETTLELARENAQSHGFEGSYYCNECGNEGDDNVCPDCQTECEWHENDGVQGCATWFMLSYHTARIGGFNWIDLLNVLKEAGAHLANLRRTRQA